MSRVRDRNQMKLMFKLINSKCAHSRWFWWLAVVWFMPFHHMHSSRLKIHMIFHNNYLRDTTDPAGLAGMFSKCWFICNNFKNWHCHPHHSSCALLLPPLFTAVLPEQHLWTDLLVLVIATIAFTPVWTVNVEALCMHVLPCSLLMTTFFFLIFCPCS